MKVLRKYPPLWKDVQIPFQSIISDISLIGYSKKFRIVNRWCKQFSSKHPDVYVNCDHDVVIWDGWERSWLWDLISAAESS